MKRRKMGRQYTTNYKHILVQYPYDFIALVA